ncbi:unnamed protein product [Cylindrotheca closterium]|uniref:SGNH hydrolase-type esterase domain-containing protein n=1 Tax=Cylindrotheca closterium TaxID=2856 RepID=A0AAD2CS31_9STRA|nr:unnamed protein product [Cylindrotheca closterium]
MESHAVDLTETVSLPALSSVLPPLTIRGVQKFGEDVFVAMFVIALLQALVALIQYRTNPSGTLVVPPGLTFGIANNASNTSPLSSIESVDTTDMNFSSAIASLASEVSSGTEPDNSRIKLSRDPKILQKINKWLFLLIPWTMERLAFFWGRNTHVMHLAVILALNRFFDFPNRFWAAKEEAMTVNIAEADPISLGKPPEHIVVIGDSLAVGLGSVEEFTVAGNINDMDPETNEKASFRKMENNQTDSGPGPVFPRVLAESLSRQFEQPVRWRSAGVDGGDLKWVDELCFDVIEDEVNQKRVPDVVVILCGPNDLKYFVSNPFQAAGPKVFRARLLCLIKKIKEVAPNAKIVVPSFPTQMFHKKSPLNIFPLNFFLDSVIGFWDSQKKMVTDSLGDEIMYFEMNPAEIFEWHNFQDHKDPTLLAPDGVHPNAKCYDLWATSLGTKIATTLTEFSTTVR